MTYKASDDLPLGARDGTFHFPFYPLSSGKVCAPDLLHMTHPW